MKIIAITGSSGFIGKHLINSINREKFSVLELDIDNNFNLLDESNFKKVPVFDVVVHLAAKTFVPDSFSNPKRFYQDNVILTLNTLEFARRNRAKVIFFSSYLYGEPQYLPIDELHPIEPHNPYAQSKLVCEKLCEGYSRDFNLSIAILRPFNIFGPWQNKNFLIPQILSQIDNGIIKLDDPRPKRDYIHVRDVIEAVKKIITSNFSGIDIFNLGSGLSYSVKEIVEMILFEYQREVKVSYTHNYRIGEVLDTVADINKAKKLLNWSPKISLSEGIADLLKNMR